MRLSLFVLLGLFATTLQADAEPDLLNQYCLGCHVPEEDGALSRIKGQRKTPEGWEMTINRMRTIHGLRLGNQDIPIARKGIAKLVKHLSDHQGLAPTESAPYRYLLEQRLNDHEDFPDELWQMCGRCHSNGRYALQRRTREEWELLIHFHLGQFPSIEYQLYARDREWVKQAFEETLPLLAEKYPFESRDWQDWQQAEKPDIAGEWTLGGHLAGRGYAHMVMTVTRTAGDNYKLDLKGQLADGEMLIGSGNAIVYTGYDLRGQFKLNDVPMRMVLSASAAGDVLTGRLFEKDQVLIGMDVEAKKNDNTVRIDRIMPAFIAQGEEQVIMISGSGLSGTLAVGDGLAIDEVIGRDDNLVALKLKADKKAIGKVMLSAGDAIGQIMVHDGIDSLKVEPAYAVARIGGNGPTPALNAAFRAVAMTNGPDNETGTGDDVRLGYLPSADWHVEPFDEAAAADDDVKYSGTMDAARGIYSPAGAGPNPDRRQSTNNAGNLKVVTSAGHLSAAAQLIVTVQVWVRPPIK